MTPEGRLRAAGALALFLLAAGAVPASQRGVPPPTVETVTGQALGAQAAAEISGAEPVTFPALIFDGPVATVSRDTVLGGLGSARVFSTPKGSLAVRYAPAAAAPAGVAPVGPCVFSRTVASGTYVVTGGTGAFAGARGRGTYSLTFITETKRSADGACSPSGVPVAAGDQVDFTAGGPLAVAP